MLSCLLNNACILLLHSALSVENLIRYSSHLNANTDNWLHHKIDWTNCCRDQQWLQFVLSPTWWIRWLCMLPCMNSTSMLGKFIAGQGEKNLLVRFCVSKYSWLLEWLANVLYHFVKKVRKRYEWLWRMFNEMQVPIILRGRQNCSTEVVVCDGNINGIWVPNFQVQVCGQKPPKDIPWELFWKEDSPVFFPLMNKGLFLFSQFWNCWNGRIGIE